MRAPALALCILASPLAAQRPAAAPTLPHDLDAYVARVMQTFEVPASPSPS